MRSFCATVYKQIVQLIGSETCVYWLTVALKTHYIQYRSNFSLAAVWTAFCHLNNIFLFIDVSNAGESPGIS